MVLEQELNILANQLDASEGRYVNAERQHKAELFELNMQIEALKHDCCAANLRQEALGQDLAAMRGQLHDSEHELAIARNQLDSFEEELTLAKTQVEFYETYTKSMTRDLVHTKHALADSRDEHRALVRKYADTVPVVS